jgi:hypothetical protein
LQNHPERGGRQRPPPTRRLHCCRLPSRPVRPHRRSRSLVKDEIVRNMT